MRRLACSAYCSAACVSSKRHIREVVNTTHEIMQNTIGIATSVRKRSISKKALGNNHLPKPVDRHGILVDWH